MSTFPEDVLGKSSLTEEKGNSVLLHASDLPIIPWEERPSGNSVVLWRYSRNPVIPRNATATSISLFNSAGIPCHDNYAGVFRCDDTRRRMNVYAGFSRVGKLFIVPLPTCSRRKQPISAWAIRPMCRFPTPPSRMRPPYGSLSIAVAPTRFPGLPFAKRMKC